jgi:hypothetical protein
MDNYFGVGLLASVVLFFVVMHIVEALQVERRRAKHMAGRTAMADGEYLEAVGAGPELGEICLAVRRALAEIGKMPAEYVQPTDDAGTILALDWENLGPDWLDLVMRVEDALDVDIPSRVLDRALDETRNTDTMTVGEFSYWLAPLLERAKEAAAGGEGKGRGGRKRYPSWQWLVVGPLLALWALMIITMAVVIGHACGKAVESVRSGRPGLGKAVGIGLVALVVLVTEVWVLNLVFHDMISK